MEKRGISSVVSSVLLILLVISAVGVFWVVVVNLTSDLDLSIEKVIPGDSSEGGSATDGGGSATDGGGSATDGGGSATDGGGSTGGDDTILSPIINASVTTCVAPCGVFFDSINTQGLLNGDFVNAYFSWDFDSTNVDPSNSRKTATGFVAGHVFENPGNYKVSVNARDSSASGSSSITIEVLPEPVGGWTTYCVSNSGTDTSCATGATALSTEEDVELNMASNSRFLFKSGETFDVVRLEIDSVDNVYVGIYGGNIKPIFSSLLTPSGAVRITNGNNVIVENIHMVGNNQGSGVATRGDSSNILIRGLEVEGSSNNVFSPGQESIGFAKGYFLFDNNIHDFSPYGVFGYSYRGAFVNNTIKEIYGNEHGIRLQGGHKTYVNDNFILNSVSKSSIQIRGNHNFAVVSDNFANMGIDAHPQNDNALEYISNVLIDGNKRIFSIDDPSGINAFTITGENITLRNNLAYDIVRLVNLEQTNVVGISKTVDIYGNSLYNVDPTKNTFVALGDATNVVIIDNIASGQGGGSLFNTIPISEVSSSNNILYLPNDPLSCLDPLGNTNCVDPLFNDVDPNSNNFLKLQASSPAVDSGVNYRGFFDDYYKNLRPKGIVVDIGGFEL